MNLLAVDGNSLVNRAYYGVRPLRNTSGIYTQAIYGFIQILRKDYMRIQPDRIVVAFDVHEPTFRHKKVASYKANRQGMPEELAMQLPYLQELLQDLGIPIITCPGYEADDILGTLGETCTQNGEDCAILTGDRDLLQRVGAHVTVYLITNKETIPYTEARFQEEYGFSPLSLIDYKALMGDASDNISGIRGIGPKTASKLIQTWQTIENLYAHIDEVEASKSILEKLRNGEEDAKQSKWLATIVTNAPIDTNLNHYNLQLGDAGKAKDLLRQLEIQSLLKLLFPEDAAETVSTKAQTQTSTMPALQIEVLTQEILAQHLEEIPTVWWDTQTLWVLYPTNSKIAYKTQDTALWLQIFQQKRITWQAKPQYRYLLSHDIEPDIEAPSGQDAEIAGYLLNPTASAYTVERLCFTYHIPYSAQNVSSKKEKDMTDAERKKQNENIARANLAALPALQSAMEEKLHTQAETKLYAMEKQLTIVLASMEHVGIELDVQGVQEFGVYLDHALEETQARIYETAGHEFNIASPKQLGDVLFVELGLPHGKKTKTGYSTNADTLNKLRGYPIVDDVLQWRQYAKLKSTYVEGLQKAVADDGRIHSNFQQTETRTGRISSTDPNLQNIPVRTELGRNMRKFFVAKSGCVLLDADYSQIELRLLANLSGDENMQNAFLSGEDIHAETAAQVFDLPRDMVTPAMRSAAKAVNFGIIYGMGAYSLSQDIHVSVQQAQQYIDNYLARFPKVGEFMETTVADAQKNGYVSTYFGRRREIPELSSTNKNVQAAGRRVARNTPIQGTAADIIKYAMIHVHKRLQREVPSAKLILQIHDELILEVPEADAPAASVILQEEMEHVLQNILPEAELEKFPVPLTTEVKQGKSWYDTKE